MSCRVALVLLAFVLAAPAAAQERPAQRYAASWQLTTQGVSQTWRVRVDGERLRADLSAYELVDLQVYVCPQHAIVRHDLKKVALVIPYKRRYEELAYDPSLDLADLDRREGVEALGLETVNGEPARRHRATQNGDTALFWLAEKDGVLLKASSTRAPGYALEVRDLVRGPQPAGAFELPAGLARVDRTREPAEGVVRGLLTALVPALGNLGSLPAEQRDGVLRECRPADLGGFFAP
jgi:hypothetical protein